MATWTCSRIQPSGSMSPHCPPAAAACAAQHEPATPSSHHLQAVDGQTCGSRPQQPASGRTGALFSARSEYTREYPEKPLVQQRAVQPRHFDLRPVPAVSLETTHGEPWTGLIRACGQLRAASRCSGAGQSTDTGYHQYSAACYRLVAGSGLPGHPTLLGQGKANRSISSEVAPGPDRPPT